MTKVYLIRHAEADGNLYRRVHGQYDGLVTPRGLEQIERLRERFRGVPLDAVWSSDLYRTRKTATALYVPKGLPLHTDPRLREINLGVWEDLTWGEAERRWPEEFLTFNDRPWEFSIEGGEHMLQMAERVYGALCHLAAQYDGKTIAVVTHGIALRALLCRWEGRPFEELLTIPHCDNTSVSLVEFYPDGHQTLRYRGDNSHLDPDTSTQAQQPWRNGDTRERFGKNVWFRPVDLSREEPVFRQYRADAWKHIHGSMDHYDEESFVRDARRCAGLHPQGLQFAMLKDRPIGMLQLDTAFPEQGVGHIPFVYLRDEVRGQRLGNQLIGEAASVFGKLGKSFLRLRVSESNVRAQRFYGRLGFFQTDLEQAPAGRLFILKKSIQKII